jgi:hypothetical protein
MEEARGRSPSQGIPRRTRRWIKALESSSGLVFFGTRFFGTSLFGVSELIGHRGATSQKLLGALVAARRELGEAPSRAALSARLRKGRESKERSSRAAPRVQRREGNRRHKQPA